MEAAPRGLGQPPAGVGARPGAAEPEPEPEMGAAGAPLPLNQGRSRTCVGQSFSQALCTGLQEKYGVPCDPKAVVEKVKALCECFDGHFTERMPREWNDVHARQGAAIEDMDKTRRYNVKVDFRKIESFEQARTEMLKAEALRMMMPCTITTDTAGHIRHSVALSAVVPGVADKMSALNSWGATETYMDVTPANFKCAVTFDPIIVEVHEGSTSVAVPQPREVYTKRSAEFAAREQEEELRRQRSAEAQAKIRELEEQVREAERLRRLGPVAHDAFWETQRQGTHPFHPPPPPLQV
eukprot:COSAG06_NODE_9619_length_1857_cov_2.552332_1_plen_296_part_00